MNKVIPAKMIRETLGFNKKEFAAMLGLHYGTICNWDAGRSEPFFSLRLLFETLAPMVQDFTPEEALSVRSKLLTKMTPEHSSDLRVLTAIVCEVYNGPLS